MTSGQNPTPAIDDEAVPDLGQAVRFFRRHWIELGGGSALGLAVALLGSWLLTPPVYRASTTLLASSVSSPAIGDGEGLSMEGYQRVLESDAVVSETERRLAEAGVIGPGQGLRIGENLFSRIFTSDRHAAPTVAPLLEAIAHRATPETAARVANTWAEVFLEKHGELMAGDLDATLAFLTEQERKLRDRLAELQAEQLALDERHREEIESVEQRWARARAQAAARWDREFLTLRREIEDLVIEHQNESRGLFEALAEENGLTANASAADRPLLELLEGRIQLAQTPRILVHYRGSSEEDGELSELWDASSGRRSGGIGVTADLALGSSELNPIHSQLALQTAALERDLVRAEPLGDSGRRRRISAALEALQRERSASLVRLLGDQSFAASELIRSRRLELERIERQRLQAISELSDSLDAATEPIELESEEARNQALNLEREYNAVQLSKDARRLARVRLAAAATPPLDPIPRPWFGKLLLGLIGGALAGLGVALVREFAHG